MAIYDDQDAKTEDLHELTDISSAEEKAMEARAADESVAQPGDIQDKESAADDTLGKGFTGDKKQNDNQKRGIFRRRGTWIGIATGGGVTGLIIGSFVFLSPLKIMHITQNLQDTFFSASEKAASDMSERLLSRYIINKVIPGMTGTCTSTRSISCSAVESTGTNPVSKLFNTWRDYKLEHKLAEKYDFEIIRDGNDPTTAKYTIRTKTTGDIDISNFTRGSFDGNLFLEIEHKDRDKIRKIARQAFEGETKWKQLYYGKKVGKLLERKYGINRCVIFCTLRDGGDDYKNNVANKIAAGKGLLISRVVGPNSEYLSLVLECAVTEFKCHNYDETDSEGRKTTKYERDIGTRVKAYLAANPGKVDTFNKHVESVKRNGVAGAIVEGALEKVGAKAAAKAIPIVGWIDLGVALFQGAENIGPGIRYMQYAVSSAAMVNTYTTYRVAADEQKMGDSDGAMLGALTETLDGAENSDFYSYVINGDTSSSGNLASLLMPSTSAQSSTSSTLEERCEDNYGVAANGLMCATEYLGGGAETPIGAIAGFLGEGIENCKNNATWLGAISPLLGVMCGQDGVIPDIWSNVFGFLADIVVKAAMNVPILGPLSITQMVDMSNAAMDLVAPGVREELLETVSQELANFFADVALVSPIADEPNAQNNLIMAAGGADVTANDVAKDVQGGRVLSSTEAATIKSEYLAQQQSDFEDQPLLSRLFDTSNSKSAVSQLAINMPSSAQTIGSQITSVATNPLKIISSIFGSLFSKKTSAAPSAATKELFGVEQYGYTDDDPVFSTTDYETWWDENNCGDPNQKRSFSDNADNYVISSSTYQLNYTKTNGCKLLESTLNVSGCFIDSLNCSAEDLGEEEEGPNTTAQFGPLDPAMLTQDTSNVACAAGTKDLTDQAGLGAGYINGQMVPIRLCAVTNFPSNAGESRPGNQDYIPGADGLTVVSSYVSANVYAMIQAMTNDLKQTNPDFTPVTSSHFRTNEAQTRVFNQLGYPMAAYPGHSNHQSGVALDFQNITSQCYGRGVSTCPGNAVYDWLMQNSSTYSFDKLSNEAWHFDPIGI